MLHNAVISQNIVSSMVGYAQNALGGTTIEIVHLSSE